MSNVSMVYVSVHRVHALIQLSFFCGWWVRKSARRKNIGEQMTRRRHVASCSRPRSRPCQSLMLDTWPPAQPWNVSWSWNLLVGEVECCPGQKIFRGVTNVFLGRPPQSSPTYYDSHYCWFYYCSYQRNTFYRNWEIQFTELKKYPPHPPTMTPTTAGFSTAVTREMQLTESKKYPSHPPTSTYYDSHYSWFYWRYFLSVSSSTGGA